MGNKEEFLKLVSDKKSDLLKNVHEKVKNRAWIRESQKIALKVLKRLDELNWTQRMLAEKMNITPQQLHKIVKGSENITLDTIVKLQTILEIPILASKNEVKSEKIINVVPNFVATVSLQQPYTFEDKRVASKKRRAKPFLSSKQPNKSRLNLNERNAEVCRFFA